jgi:putative endonuclease
MNKKDIGKKGEDLACSFLENNGISIIKRNYNTKYGEIDLIGIENKTIIFIEVKLRNNLNYGLPFEAVNFSKVRKIKHAAMCFLSDFENSENDCRFDIVSLTYDKSLKNYCIDWLKNQYFD